MNRADTAKNTMEQRGIPENGLSAAFPEFEEVKNRLIYGEVRHQGELSERQRMLTVIAALATVEGGDLEEQLNASLRQGGTPAELQEVFHQAAPYIGIAKAEKGFAVLKRVFEAKGIALPLKKQGTVTEENRLEQGLHAQKALFGPMIDRMRASAPEDQKPIQDYLSAYCFGDTYTRGALDLATREMLTFVCIVSLGGCDSQAKAHVGANLAIGNSAAMLVSVVAQCLPYIGFPRTLNAVAAINEVLKMQSQAK